MATADGPPDRSVYFVPDEEIISQDGKWHRTGGCTTKYCGACCRFLVLPLDPRIRLQPAEKLADFELWLRYHGIEMYETGDWLAVKLPIPCEKLTDEGQCGVYGTPDRPNLCSRIPRSPLDVEGIEECTYEFTPTNIEAFRKILRDAT